MSQPIPALPWSTNAPNGWKKSPALIEALAGQFTDHHGFLLDKMVTRVQTLDRDIAAVEAQIEQNLTPLGAETAKRLDQIPGVGLLAAWAIIAEIGLDMTRFPTAGHLCSWAKFAPGVSISAGRKVGTSATGHGNRYLARVLGEIAVSVGRTNTFLGARY